ncbi:CDP-alcohol phosphatidyltransferase family protein, partial [Patescibacteria group bacterium]|nr:CDP-alcohol phosphatidyltransferase family protein [Patescibacteria group bacterium]
MDFKRIITLDHKNPLARKYLTGLKPLINWLSKVNANPNVLTVIGAVIAVIATIFIYYGQFVIGGIILIVALNFDALDGTIARLLNKTSRFGAYLDSLLDRYTDIAIFLALYFHFFYQLKSWQSFIFLLAITGSLLVSYARARAEGLDIDCEVGLVQRAPRLIALIISIFLIPVWGINIILVTVF